MLDPMPHAPEPAPPAGGLLPVVPWVALDRRRYRALRRGGRARPAIVLGRPAAGRATVVFVHGRGGYPAQFAALARALDPVADTAAFVWEDRARLVPSAEALRTDVLALPGRVAIVAASLGALLPAYLGATDPDGRLGSLGAVYLNPLIGGSRWADADRALAVLGDLPALRWLHDVKRLVQRTCFPPVVQDLAPESAFQQAVFGRASRPSSFAHATKIVFTERPGAEPDVRASRVRRFFGRPRRELLARMGDVVDVAAEHRTGHAAPLANAAIALGPIVEVLRGLGAPASSP